ncbi:hypothetical protein MMC25_005551 [Agyrium rufum]|nr:hypothetical protein [Agyrium rufum]
MAVANPVAFSDDGGPKSPISKKEISIGGILTNVFGLDELPASATTISCLWLLHPRTLSQACMEPIAVKAITDWNKRVSEGKAQDFSSSSSSSSHGLIAVSFDQRNHGSRKVSLLANEAWDRGNETHAPDMLSCITLGISLGGHAAWQSIIHDANISTAIVVIGCPDYVRMMSDRARLSKRKSWTETDPPGKDFIGSVDFPESLIEVVRKYDPAGYLHGQGAFQSIEGQQGSLLSEDATAAIQATRLEERLKGKRILCLSGGADKLVPYRCSEPFMTWLKDAMGPNGVWRNGNLDLRDRVFDGVGHEMTGEMLQVAVDFILEALDLPSAKVAGASSRL